MKRILVCAAMFIGCGSLHAQEKPLLSFKDYLNKKKEFVPVHPNVFTTPRIIRKWNQISIDSKMLPYTTEQFRPSSVAKLSRILPNGNKLYLLAQDNMPCVVPDMSQFNMPVAKSGNHCDEKINGSDQEKLIP